MLIPSIKTAFLDNSRVQKLFPIIGNYSTDLWENELTDIGKTWQWVFKSVYIREKNIINIIINIIIIKAALININIMEIALTNNLSLFAGSCNFKNKTDHRWA